MNSFIRPSMIPDTACQSRCQYPVSKELLDRYDKLNAEYDSAAAISRKNWLLDPINAW